MALPSINDAFYPTPDETLAIALTNVRYAYDLNGVEVNVTDGSELFERFKVLADLVSIAINNNRIALSDVSPLDASGDALTELAGMYGVYARPASSAAGVVLCGVAGTGTVTVPVNFVGTSPTGIQVKTVSAFTISDGGGVTVQAVSGGDNTDLEEDGIVTWDSAAIGSLDQVATVGQGGITGGADADTEDEVRRRLLQRLRDPSIGGNAAFVASTAEGASAAVERGFVYMGARGASSYDLAITRDTGDRVLSAAVVNTVASIVVGEMPGSANLNATSVLAELVDVVIDVTLPLPVNAGGAGGGWHDAAPWPSDADAADTYAEITVVDTAANTVTVNSTALDIPLVGQRIGIWDYNEEEMHEFTINTVAGPPGAYVIKLDGAMGFAEVGMFVSAGAINLTQYADEFLAAMKALGPGEKTSNVDKLPRALRYPGSDLEYPQDITSIQLNSVMREHPEILNMEYAADPGPAIAAEAALHALFTDIGSPTVATIETDPPNVLVVKHLSFRRKT